MLCVYVCVDKNNIPIKVSVYRKGNTHHEYLSNSGEFKEIQPLSCGNFEVKDEFIIPIAQVVPPATTFEEKK